MKTTTLACAFFTSALLLGCASTQNSADSNSKAAPLSSEGVPSIAVAIECGKCEVSPDITKRIRESYMNAAGVAGARVSATETATLRIESFSDRGAGRLLIAAIAGPVAMIFHVDRIKGTLVASGAQFPIDETARFPFTTIDSVANDVGETAFKRLANK
ncbi:MAG: hypothetical protein ACRDAM_15450 [Casimicrobium sp.]